MSDVIKNLVVPVGAYEDPTTGQTINRFRAVGVMMQKEDRDGKPYSFILFDRAFNPAGVPDGEGSNLITIIMMDPTEGDPATPRTDGEGPGGGNIGDDLLIATEGGM